MAYEIYWADLGSTPNCEGFEECSSLDMALEWARTRILFSSRDSFAFVNDKTIKHVLDGRIYRVHWNESGVIHYDRDSPDWNKPRARSD